MQGVPLSRIAVALGLLVVPVACDSARGESAQLTQAVGSPSPDQVPLDPATIPTELLLRYQDRIMFGSDFPLIPYPYEEEQRFVETRELPDAVARKILYENAARFLAL